MSAVFLNLLHCTKSLTCRQKEGIQLNRHRPVDPEEMQKRLDEDYHAMLEMIGEGSPVFESDDDDEKDLFQHKLHKRNDDELPETDQ